jgi:hypothetical protein
VVVAELGLPAELLVAEEGPAVFTAVLKVDAVLLVVLLPDDELLSKRLGVIDEAATPARLALDEGELPVFAEEPVKELVIFVGELPVFVEELPVFESKLPVFVDKVPRSPVNVDVEELVTRVPPAPKVIEDEEETPPTPTFEVTEVVFCSRLFPADKDRLPVDIALIELGIDALGELEA